MASEFDEETLHNLYAWVDDVPLSRPKRNMARDFSDGVLAAEIVKYYFPKLVEMHNYVPANSVQQKLSNWTILNRKVLSRLNFSVPEDVIRKIVQCSPGVAELVLKTLKQKIEEKQKQGKDAGETPRDQVQVEEENNHTDTGYSPKQKNNAPVSNAQQPPKGEQVSTTKGQQGYAQAMNGDTSFRIQLAEKDQALLASQESVQILQVKVRRLEQLLHLKNVRIDDLTRRLQEAEEKAK
ncbi:sperm flagellar protein 1 [Ambystoma mexicanum]|uniref:sperm flagellar protein 1 n=1 Tax=Ambystoma mexicanum TaxID=8296 RepID=UPI0037E77641